MTIAWFGLAHICRVANNAIRLAAEQPLVCPTDDPSGQCAYCRAYASEATVDDDGDLVGGVTHTDDCMWSRLAKAVAGEPV